MTTFTSLLLLSAALAASPPETGLTLPETMEGHIRVTDAQGNVVLELEKRPGSKVEVALPPGSYSMRRRPPHGPEVVLQLILSPPEQLPESAPAPAPAPEPAPAPAPALAPAPAPAPASPPAPAPAPAEVPASPAAPAPAPAPAPVAGDVVSIGVFAHALAVQATSLGLLFTHVERDARWFQGSLLANATGGEMRGFQLSLGVNSAGPMDGVQLTSLFNGSERLSGAQISSGVNVARGAMRGLQISGLFNWAEGSSVGMQATSGLNSVPGSFAGWQVSGVANWAESLRGVQTAVLNVAGDATGAQIGVVNVARKLSGFQLALVNVADEANGAPLGLLNVIRDGQMHLEVFGSDLQPVNVALKSGSKHFFTTVVVGGGRRQTFLYGFGLGVHVGDRVWLDADLLSTTTLRMQLPLEHANIGGHLRLLGGLQLGPLGVFAGPTVNVAVKLQPGVEIPTSYLRPYYEIGRVQLWPGFQAGIRL